jgi:FtsH-binding integral membrane protein
MKIVRDFRFVAVGLVGLMIAILAVIFLTVPFCFQQWYFCCHRYTR